MMLVAISTHQEDRHSVVNHYKVHVGRVTVVDTKSVAVT